MKRKKRELKKKGFHSPCMDQKVHRELCAEQRQKGKKILSIPNRGSAQC